MPQLPICLCASLRQVSRLVTQSYDEAFRPLGLTAMQFYLLMEIQAARGITPSGLAERAGLDLTTLSRSLALLERNGWVESSAGADRRSKQYQLTKQGAALVKRAFPKWQAVQQQALTQLGPGAWESLRPLLERLTTPPVEER